jgi:hypothetical protein
MGSCTSTQEYSSDSKYISDLERYGAFNSNKIIKSKMPTDSLDRLCAMDCQMVESRRRYFGHQPRQDRQINPRLYGVWD